MSSTHYTWVGVKQWLKEDMLNSLPYHSFGDLNPGTHCVTLAPWQQSNNALTTWPQLPKPKRYNDNEWSLTKIL